MSFEFCIGDLLDVIMVMNELRKDHGDTARKFRAIPCELKAFAVFHQYVDVDMTNFMMPICRAGRLQPIILGTRDLFRRLHLFAHHSIRDNEVKKVKHVEDQGQREILSWLGNKTILAQ